MENLTAYTMIARKIDDQEPHTAPKAADGSIHEAFISFLELVYSPEESEIVQHLNLLPSLMTPRAVADASGKSLAEVEKILKQAHEKNSIAGMDNLYSSTRFWLPGMPYDPGAQ